MKKSIYAKCLLLLVLAWLCASCSVAVASPQTSVDYKMMSTAQWEQLKLNHQSLVLRLSEAKLQATTLQKQSDELNQRLEEAEKLLAVSMQELQNSKLSLQSAKDWQEKTRKSLQELTARIEAERKKQEAIQRRLRAQRTLAYFFLGLAVVTK